jgi:hypothetical protein
MTLTKIDKVKKFYVLKCWIFSLRAEGFSCSLDVLYGGLGICKLQFLIKKILNFFSSCKFFSIFIHRNPGIRTGIQPKMLDPDPESGSKHCLGSNIRVVQGPLFTHQEFRDSWNLGSHIRGVQARLEARFTLRGAQGQLGTQGSHIRGAHGPLPLLVQRCNGITAGLWSTTSPSPSTPTSGASGSSHTS